MLIVSSDGNGADALHCSTSIAPCKPRGSFSVKLPKCCIARAPHCKRGTCGRSVLMRVPRWYARLTPEPVYGYDWPQPWRGGVSVRSERRRPRHRGNAPGRTGEVREGGPMVNYVELVDYKLFSADSHVSEPPDLWVERIGQAYAYRAPRVESRLKDGRRQEFLLYEGFPPHPVSVGLASAAREGNRSEYTESGKGYSGALQGGWDPAARLADQDLDGVEAEILHATLCFRLFWLQDAALQRACFTAYNDWLAEFCTYAPKRLIGVPCISLYDSDLAMEELQRTAKLGLRGAMIWLSPPAGAPAYDAPI